MNTSSASETKSNTGLIYVLSKKSLVILIIYYLILLIAGLVLLIRVGCLLTEELDTKRILLNTFLSSLAASATFCSIQYIRRLYKACIDNRVIDADKKHESFGNLIYFSTRPLFALSFSVFLVFILLSGMYVVSGNLDYIINDKFLYLCVILSGVIGYSIGKVLDRFELLSEDKINQIK